ncbi:hypothetical protein, partial [Rubrimonas sp.]|uniref:hypothetical protein n=1 Tax=Rubrimonas sp. TaxID=2036015 RepID=UPI002FDEA49B
RRADIGHRKASVWKEVSASRTFQAGAPHTKLAPRRAAVSFNPPSQTRSQGVQPIHNDVSEAKIVYVFFTKLRYLIPCA